MLTFHHPDADLHFSWDGGMQILIRSGNSLPAGAFPDRVDIREPDHGTPTHLFPWTQAAFDALCDTWWRGSELGAGLRDYAADPWQHRSWGPTEGVFRYRYAGGSHIEIAHANIADWYPLIGLDASGRTPGVLSTGWLMERTHGWELAWLAAHGISSPSDDFDDLYAAIVTWSRAQLPAPGPRDSIMGVFSSWLYRTVAAEFTTDGWQHHHDRGAARSYVTPERPVTTTRRAQDGTRWNFTWLGHPYACVWSPDRQLSNGEHYFAGRPSCRERLAAQQWLDEQADTWLHAMQRTGRIPEPVAPRPAPARRRRPRRH
ncbi:hypothetical protein [Amycolatopsis sp. NPDC058986]|uniref:hypothetical protein n=1 Tax=unclassified Amycolatopsis TaxID=2618356 RepID=UPI00366D09EA